MMHRVLLILSAAGLFAQTYKTSILDGALAPAVEKGAPAGSTAPSEMERINLFNGNLSIVVPLLNVGGRGEAGYQMVVKAAGSPFTTELTTTRFCPPEGDCTGYTFTTAVHNAKQDAIESLYSPGVVYVKRGRRIPSYCATGNYTLYRDTLTTVIFERPDGTSHEMSDGGLVGFSSCQTNQNVTRQNRFRAMDDSGITFISSLPITDAYYELDQVTSAANGTLLFPNGVRYAVENGVVTKITDRNGNFTTLTYLPSSRLLSSVEDSQGRIITVEIDKSSGGENFDHIRYRGAGGSLHEIRVKRVRLQSFASFIRSDLGTQAGSFSGLSWGDVRFDMLPIEIKLTDGRKYSFRYSPYGEVARVENPAGGAVEYDHGAGYNIGAGGPDVFSTGQILRNPFGFETSSSADAWRPAIYRRLLERRTYPTGGTGAAYEGKTTYSRRETISQGGTGAVILAIRPFLEQTDSGMNVATPVVSRHYFHENGTLSVGPRPTQSPVQSMLTSSLYLVALAHDRNAFEGVPYKVLRPSVEMTDTGFAMEADGALRACQERRTLLGSSALVSGKQMRYNALGNLEELLEFDFGNAPAFGSVVSRTDAVTSESYEVPLSCSTLATNFTRRTITNYVSDSSYVGDLRHLQRLIANTTSYGSDNAIAKRTEILYDQSTPLAAESSGVSHWDDANYPASMGVRGNPTAVKFAVTGSGGSITEWLQTGSQYDVLGNLRASSDANGNTSTYSYVDNCFVGPSTIQLAYRKTTQFPAVNGLTMSTQTSYDCWAGKPRLFTDVNGVESEYTYETGDTQLDRILSVKKAKGSDVEAQQNFQYTDTPGSLKIRVTSALRSANDGAMWTDSYFDNFGRLNREVSNGIEKQTIYDGAGRVWKVSNPSTNGTFLFTENKYDSAGRLIEVKRPDNKIVSTTYDRNATSVVDEASVQRRTTMDGLGRLIAVTEDPAGLNYTTKYAYNANDALLTVCPQGGTLSGSICTGSDRQRKFSYDLLARVKTVENPEASMITYFYDEAASTNGKGNLTKRTQQRGLSSSLVSTEVRYNYDAWNRPAGRAYTGDVNGVTTPSVEYRYDSHEVPVPGVTSYPKGRLTAVKSGGVEMAIDSFDAQGRPTRSRQVTDGTTYRFGDAGLPGYEYLRQGALAKMRYPSGREVSYTHDDLGRPLAVNGALGAETKTYVQGVQYTAFGAVSEMRLNGTNLRERFQYSPERLQLTGLDVEKCANENCTGPEELLHLEYVYGAMNNGNPREQVIRSSGINVRQVYGYDSLNRIQSFREEPAAGGTAAVNEDYCYDRHGNRAVVSRPGLSSMTPQVTSCSEGNVLTLFPGNRIAGSNYDAGGELANDGRSDLRFDIEDRLRKTIPVSGSETSYLYDGDGKRVMKQTGTAKTVFVYDAMGHLAAEFGGVVTTGTQYLHGDMLGSTRLVTNGTAVSRRFDYFPFGGELTSGETSYRGSGAGFVVAGDPAQRFTGKERDQETGLDYFGARYLSSAQGRFASPDNSPDGISVMDPQSWNRYAYTSNRPLHHIDIDGKWASAVHKLIIDVALSRYLSAGEIKVLKWRQVVMDADQTKAGSYKHAMRGSSQSISDASEQTNAFIQWNLGKARSARRNPDGSISKEALNSWGDAMHTGHDMTSLQHRSASGDPLPYGGLKSLPFNLRGMFLHVAAENEPSDDWAGFMNAVRITLDTYIQVDPTGAARKGLTYNSLEAVAQKQVSEFIDRFYKGSMSDVAARKKSEAARQCAYGNPAACGIE